MGDYKHSIETVTAIINGSTFKTKENEKPVQLAMVVPGQKKSKGRIEWHDSWERSQYLLG